jgi:hypothetical protein
VTSSLTPPAMAGAMMAYSSGANRFVLFGGWDGIGLNETWSFDPAMSTWSQLHPALSPMTRGDAMFAYDSKSDVFVLFGGWHELANETYQRLADTWLFYLSNDTWVPRNPIASPSARSDAAVAYNPVRDAVLLFGGFSGTVYLGDGWTYSVERNLWSPWTVATSPSPRADGRMVYDAVTNQVYLFGGNDYSGPNLTFHHLDDTLMFNWTVNGWTTLASLDAPAARDYAVVADDPADGRLLLADGYGNGIALGDTWAFDVRRDVWENVTPPIGPEPRFAGVGGFDPVNGVLVLFGGLGTKGLLADTWYFRYDPTLVVPQPSSGLPWLWIGIGTVAAVAVLAIMAWRVRRRPSNDGTQATGSADDAGEHRGP